MSQTLTQIGKYRIERELGRGAMGVVYKAFDPVVERMVAIKTIRLDVEDAGELIIRLRREAKSVGQLEHPNIVTLYDAGESGGLFYLAMQFIQGETLQNRLERQRWFSLKEVEDVFGQICAGLDYAHQRGVIHRDIKPANIMITIEGVVKLTDFGIAKVTGTGTTTTGLVVGTPSYMSPEQALGKPLDGRSDIFSLGSILYEMMAGEKAFPGQNVTTVMYKIVHESPTPLVALQPGLDPAVEAIVLKTLAKHPEQRFQTCSELAAALQLYINQAVAAMPKTSVAYVPSISPVVPPPVPTPVPSAAVPAVPVSIPPAGVQPAAPGSSPGVVPVAAPTAGTASQTAAGRAGVPLAWVGGGVLGTLLLVTIILLVVQMRQPAGGQAPASQPAATAPQTTSSSPASTPGTTTQPTGSQDVAKPSEPTTQAANTATVPTDRSATGRAPKRIATPRKTKTINHPAPQQAQPPAVTAGSAPDTAIRSGSAPATATTPTVAQPGPAVSAEPENFSALTLNGDLAFQSGDYQKALAAYLKAYRLNPASRAVKTKLRTVLTLLGRPEEALKYK